MPVDDHPIHDRVRHARPTAGCLHRQHRAECYIAPSRNYRPDGSFTTSEVEVVDTLSPACRQVGIYAGGFWVPLPECEGCTAAKDHSYITKARRDIDRDLRRTHLHE